MRRLAVIDLETTGMDPIRDRITEVAVILLDDDVVTHTWQTLINPGVGIPSEIQALTGISNAMVRDAPSFESIANTLNQLLSDRIFVAHNARFDYGFVKQSFAREGLAFTADVLCSVRLSRRLEPAHASHSLDALIVRHDLKTDSRHRAIGDAQLVVRLMQVLLERHGEQDYQAAVKRILKMPSLPPHLPMDAIDNIPDCPGVYVFYGVNDLPIYIGKSVDLRARVRSHFSSDYRTANDTRLSAEIRRIETQPCAGEMGALVLEALWVKQRSPGNNKALRAKKEQGLLQLNPEKEPVFSLVTDWEPAQLAGRYGPFTNKRTAKTWLQSLASANGLCWTALGLEKREGPCFGHQVRKCYGLCVGQESALMHHARLVAAMADKQMPAWPFLHYGVVKEHSVLVGTEYLVFKDWCFVGLARNEQDLWELGQTKAELEFDLDIYRLLIKAHENGSLKPLVVH